MAARGRARGHADPPRRPGPLARAPRRGLGARGRDSHNQPSSSRTAPAGGERRVPGSARLPPARAKPQRSGDVETPRTRAQPTPKLFGGVRRSDSQGQAGRKRG